MLESFLPLEHFTKNFNVFGYSWITPGKDFDMDTLLPNPLFFCDDPYTWASPWLKGERTEKLYIFRFQVDKPKIMRGSHFEIKLSKILRKCKKRGFDTITYIPREDHPKIRQPGFVRQGVILYPKFQIKEITKVSIDWPAFEQDYQKHRGVVK